MPNQRDLLDLPYFAILALGARGARYVEPLLRRWIGAHDERLQVIDDAIEAVEALAACSDHDERDVLWESASARALAAAEVASAADCSGAPVEVLHAADSVAELAPAIDRELPREAAARAVTNSLRVAAAAARSAEGSDVRQFTVRVNEDLRTLKRRAAEEQWDDRSAVPVGVFA